MGSVLGAAAGIGAACRLFARVMLQDLAPYAGRREKGLWCLSCIPRAGDVSVAPRTSWEVVA